MKRTLVRDHLPRLLLLLLLLVLLPACGEEETPAAPAPEPSTGPAPPSLGGGIQINEDDHDRYARWVAATGMDSIQVTAYSRQARWDTAELSYEPEDAEHLVTEIRAAKAAGLKVLFVLRTYLEHAEPANRHMWHGMIHPPDDELDLWFERYTAFAAWGADLATREGIDLLVVGNELNSMTSTTQLVELPDLLAYQLDPERTAKVRGDLVSCAGTVDDRHLQESLSWLDGHQYPDLDAALRSEESTRRTWAGRVAEQRDGVPDLDAMNARRARLERGWRAVIAEVRGRYTGPIAYGANFDQYDQVGFWDAVDALGVTSYFPLSRWGVTGDEQRRQLRRGWERVAADLGAVAAAARPADPLPVYLLELGWTRRAGTTVRPWSYDRVEVLETAGSVLRGAAPPLTCVHWATQAEDQGERERAMEALAELVRDGGFDELRGFSLWKITTNAQHREEEPFAIVLPPPATPGQPATKHLSDYEMVRIAGELSGLLQ
jgi:hypothetical protein